MDRIRDLDNLGCIAFTHPCYMVTHGAMVNIRGPPSSAVYHDFTPAKRRCTGRVRGCRKSLLYSLTYQSVFAIHGLGSNPETAWTYRGNGTEVSWLRDILPQQDGLQQIRVALINHQTCWDSNAASMTLEDHANMLLDSLEQLHQVISCVILGLQLAD